MSYDVKRTQKSMYVTITMNINENRMHLKVAGAW